MGQKNYILSPFPGTETPLDVKTYSLFPTLSLNVPFVLQKEFQAHLQSVELFFVLFFFQMQHFCFVAEAEECFGVGFV